MEPYINTDRSLYPKKKKSQTIYSLPPKEHLRGYRSYLEFILFVMKSDYFKHNEIVFIYGSMPGVTFYEFTRDMLKDKMLEEILNVLGEYNSDNLLNVIKAQNVSSSDMEFFKPLILLFDDLEGFKALFK